VNKAVHTENFSAELLVRLAMFICKSIDDFARALEENGDWQLSGASAYSNFFLVQYYCYVIFTQYPQSKFDKENDNHGIACDRMQYCVEQVIPEIRTHQALGHLSFYKNDIEEFFKQCISYREFVEKENSGIYFGPTSEKFPGLPKNWTQRISLDKEQPFKLPDPAFTNIHTK
jgi:hypothetical protein